MPDGNLTSLSYERARRGMVPPLRVVEQYDIDAMGRIYELRPDGSRGRLVAAFVTWSSAARELMRLNGRP